MGPSPSEGKKKGRQPSMALLCASRGKERHGRPGPPRAIRRERERKRADPFPGKGNLNFAWKRKERCWQFVWSSLPERKTASVFLLPKKKKRFTSPLFPQQGKKGGGPNVVYYTSTGEGKKPLHTLVGEKADVTERRENCVPT